MKSIAYLFLFIFISSLAVACEGPAAHIKQGDIYSTDKQWALAVKEYSRAIELDPKNAIAYNDRGLAYNSSGQRVSAVVDFTK
ncbi:MAG: tetratricopeptide repeat protein, partial [Dehalococcoidia bacterium]